MTVIHIQPYDTVTRRIINVSPHYRSCSTFLR